MKMKGIMAGLAFATALTLSSITGAQAVQVYNATLFDAGSPLQDGSADSVQQCFNESATSRCVAVRGGHNYIGEFQDDYSILVNDTTNVSFTAAPANPIKPSITDFVLTLLQGDTIVATATNFSDFVYEVLAGQSYILRVTGMAPNGSSYTVDVSGIGGGGGTTPVPLPGAFPLLAAGLAGMGFLHRRKKQPRRSV